MAYENNSRELIIVTVLFIIFLLPVVRLLIYFKDPQITSRQRTHYRELYMYCDRIMLRNI